MTEEFEPDRQYKIVYQDEFVIYGKIIEVTDDHYIIETKRGIIHRKKSNVLKIDPTTEYRSDM